MFSSKSSAFRAPLTHPFAFGIVGSLLQLGCGLDQRQMGSSGSIQSGDDSASDTACEDGTVLDEGSGRCVLAADCVPGSWVVVEAESGVQRECAPCETGTFSSSFNQDSCEPHTVCPSGTRIDEPGTATSNTVCVDCSLGTSCAGGDTEAEECEAGHWNHDLDPATACVPWSDCAPGTFAVELEGTTTTDRICAACPEGTFTDSTNAEECLLWSTCEEGTVIDVPGAANRDVACIEENEWVVQFGSENSDSLSDIVLGDDDYLFVTGTERYREDSDIRGHSFVARLDALSGEFELAHEFDSRDCWFGPCSRPVALTAVPGEGLVLASNFWDGWGRWHEGALRRIDPDTLQGDEFLQIGAYSAYDFFYDLETDRSGNLQVLGSTEKDLFGEGSFLGGHYGSGHGDAFMMSVTKDGDELWGLHHGTSESDHPYAMALDGDGHVFVTGNTQGTFEGFDEAENEERKKFYSCRDAETGESLWDIQLPADSSFYRATDLVAGDDGFIYAVGYTGGTVSGFTNSGGYDIWVSKLRGATGEVVWDVLYGSPGRDWHAKMVADGQGSLFVFATAGGTFAEHPVEGTGSIVVTQLSAESGQRIKSIFFGPHEDDSAAAISLDRWGNLILAGNTEGAFPGEDSLGEQDAWAARWITRKYF